MKEFLDKCAEIGVADVSTRRATVEASLHTGNYDITLFLACGYNYIFTPDDGKFAGIRKVFLEPSNAGLDGASLALNLYPDCFAAVKGMLTGGDAKIVTELGSPYQYKDMVYPAGVSPGLAGNYNMCTKALNLIVTHDRGLKYQDSLNQAIKAVKKAREAPEELSAMKRNILTQARATLAAKGWKDDDLVSIGLSA